MASMRKRLLSFVMAFAMMVSLLPLSALAAETTGNSEIQIQRDSNGNTLYYSPEGGESTDSWVTNNQQNPRVQISKEIAGTGTENEFNVTLNVKTNQKVTKVETAPDAAVTLVLDTSVSMGRPANGTDGKTRWQITKEAAIEFAKAFEQSKITYQDAAGNTCTTKRLISLVTFASMPSVVDFGSGNWLDLTQPGSLKTFEDAIEKINPVGKTNVTGGLKKASRLMDGLFQNPGAFGVDQLTRANSSILLLGDGEPNCTVSPSPGDQYQPYSPANEYPYYLYPFQDAERWVRKIRTDGTKVITAYAGTDANDQGYQWFKNFDPNCKLVSNVKDLVDAFTVSLTLLQLNAKAWIVNDTLGDNLTIANSNGANVVPAPDGKSLTWSLRMDTPEVWKDGVKLSAGTDVSQLQGNYELRYSTTYRVKLDSTGANATQDALTSSSTVLKYYLTDENNNFVDNQGTVIDISNIEPGQGTDPVLLSMQFKNPKVHALTGNFQFEKQAYHTKEALPGAEFRAILKDGGTEERNFGGQPSSDADGIVSFSGLPSGQSYRIHEQAAPTGYDAGEDEDISVQWGKVYYQGKEVMSNTNAYVCKNKLTPTYTSFTVTKQWFDGDSTSRPASIRIDLEQYEAGQKVSDDNYPVTLTEADAVKDQSFQWRKTITNLPAINVETGNSYTYKAVEKTVPDGYTSNSGTDPNVISNVAQSTTTVSGTKTWLDPQGTTHQEVVIQLLADGDVVAEKTLTNGEETYTFENLPKYKVDGTGANGAITYTVKEKDVPVGYTSEKGAGAFDIINRINQDYQPIHVSVSWLDNSNAYSTRPESVTVTLKADGQPVGEPVTIAGDGSQNTWTYTFAGTANQEVNGNPVDGFPVYKIDANGKVTGERIAYTMEQTPATPLTTDDSYTLIPGTDGLSSTNLLAGETSVSGSKTWFVPEDFTSYPEVTIRLSDGQETKLENNAFAFNKLAKYNDAGVLNIYNISEYIVGDGKTNFSKSFAQQEDGTWSLTNEYHEKTTVSGKKIWQDNNNEYHTRPAEFTVNLLADGKKVDSQQVASINEATFTFKDLEKYRYETEVVTPEIPAEMNEDGSMTEAVPAVTKEVAVEIEYTVTEEPISGTLDNEPFRYQPTYDDNYNITNTLTGQTTVSGQVKWLDKNNEYGTRPANGAELVLYRNAQTDVQGTTHLSNDGEYRFNDVNKFDENGVKYVYRVTENPINGYQITPDGFNFTNKLNQQFQTYSGEKVWIDGGLAQHPEVTIHLQQDGMDYDQVTLKSGTTQFTFGSSQDGNTLPVFQYDENTGDVIGKHVYSLREDQLAGYTTKIEDGKVFNTIAGIQDVTGLTFTKYWIVPENYHLPEATFTIKQNGQVYKIVSSKDMTKTEGGFYTYTEANLPLYSNDGTTAYTYTVEETGVPDGFTVSKEAGNIFKNVIDPGSVILEGKKTWDANPLSYAVEIQVFRDGETAPCYTATVGPKDGAENKGSFAFEIGGIDAEGKGILPKYASDGHEYQYTMKEVPVEGYTVKQDGNHFTNSYQHFPYRVTAHYTATVDGVVVVNGETKDLANGNPGYFDNNQRSIMINTEANKDFTSKDGKSYSYTFAGATLKIGDAEAQSFSGNTLALSTPDQPYTLDLNYTYTYNAPVIHNVTVNYYNYASVNSANPTKIADSRSISGEKGSTYDASALNAISISGYSYVQTTADALVGTLDGDKSINVWYSERRSGGGGRNGGGSNGGTQNPPTIEILDTAPPLAGQPIDIPEAMPPLANLPEMEEFEQIPEVDVPLGDAPKTGDESKGGLWLSLMALSAWGIAALTNFGKKREDKTEGK